MTPNAAPSPMTARLDTVLRAQLHARHVEVIDESHLHAGHAGARSGGGHYRVVVVADAFEGKALLARHRLVHALFEEELKGAIHALALTTFTESEWSARPKG